MLRDVAERICNISLGLTVLVWLLAIWWTLKPEGPWVVVMILVGLEAATLQLLVALLVGIVLAIRRTRLHPGRSLVRDLLHVNAGWLLSLLAGIYPRIIEALIARYAASEAALPLAGFLS